MAILSLEGGRRLCLLYSYNIKIKVKFSLLSQGTIHHFYKHKHILPHDVYKSVSQKLYQQKQEPFLHLQCLLCSDLSTNSVFLIKMINSSCSLGMCLSSSSTKEESVQKYLGSNMDLGIFPDPPWIQRSFFRF